MSGVPQDPNIQKPKDPLAEAELKKLQAESNLVAMNTFNKFKDMWIDNFGANLHLSKAGKGIKDIKPNPKPAIIVGAGPSLTDKDIDSLKNFDGTIIVTNKSLKRLLEHGVIPDWVCAVDSLDIVFDSFNHDIIIKYAKQINAYLPACISPKVANFCAKNFKEIYWSNVAIPIEEAKNMVWIMCKLNGKNEVHSGGNAGSFGYLLSVNWLGAKVIGILGIELCEKPNPKWTKQQAGLYEYVYNPEEDQILAVNLALKSYISILDRYISIAKKKKSAVTVNLTPWGIWYAVEKSKMITMKLNNFIDEYSKGDRVDQKPGKDNTKKKKEERDGIQKPKGVPKVERPEEKEKDRQK